MIRNISVLLCIILMCACKNSAQSAASNESATEVPLFSSDSAYGYIQKQVDFGPRVPNTAAHRHCADYLVTTLQRFGATVISQKVKLTAFNGDKLDAHNIIASFSPEKTNRILLFAHWDTRPWSDHDPDRKIFTSLYWVQMMSQGSVYYWK